MARAPSHLTSAAQLAGSGGKSRDVVASMGVMNGMRPGAAIGPPRVRAAVTRDGHGSDRGFRQVISTRTQRGDTGPASLDADRSRGTRAGLLAWAARAELHPGQDGDGRHDQPGGEQEVDGEADDDYGHYGHEYEGDDAGHGDRSPFRVEELAGQGTADLAVVAGHPRRGNGLVFTVTGDEQPRGDVEGRAGTGAQRQRRDDDAD